MAAEKESHSLTSEPFKFSDISAENGETDRRIQPNPALNAPTT